MTKKLYYMHPISTYGTSLEDEQIELISSLFPGWVIINPNRPEHQEGYRLLEKETGNGMPYFTELAAQCQGGIMLPFRDGKIGAGVFKEAVRLIQNDCPVWELTFDGKLSKVDTLDESRKLSVEETIERIRDKDGNTKEY